MTARVLVVDDIDLIRDMLERKLTDEYFDVITAAGGVEALKLAEQEQPDLVLLDVCMPDLDGFKVCAALKSSVVTAHIPVLMMTGVDGPAERRQGLAVGADDFLIKPIVDIELYARVRSLVRLKLSLDELRSRALTEQILQCPTPRHEAREATANIVLIAEPGDAKDLEDQLNRVGPLRRLDIRTRVERLAHSNCDVIVVCLGETPNDGLRAIARLRAGRETRMIPILAASGTGDLKPLVKAFELGVGDCLKLPADDIEAQARLHTLLKRKRIADRLRENAHMSLQLAVTDAVTGLYNRHYMQSHLLTLDQRARGGARPYSIAMFDLDHFKQVNDLYGHEAGDRVLRQFAERLSRNLRGIDLAARYGGEEFAVIMPDTGLADARRIVQRLTRLTEAEPFVLACGRRVSVTASAGVATLTRADESSASVLGRADAALYRAKATGRNRVEADRTASVAA